MNKNAKVAKPAKAPASPDKLAKPKVKGQVELDEEELKRVSGGAGWHKATEKWIE